MLHIDGSHGEGGGQILRTAVALSAVTGRSIRVEKIRANRPRPGLSHQHITSIQSVAKICNAHVLGLNKSSPTIEFHPKDITGGEFHFDVGTAGSITLVLQACLLPALFSKNKCTFTITGGTDVKWSPPIDYFRFIYLPLLKKMGVRVKVQLMKRGYYPKGGGEVTAEIEPVKELKSILLTEIGEIKGIKGVVYTSHLPDHVAQRMRDAALKKLDRYADVKIELERCDLSLGPGTGIVLWAETDFTVLGANYLGEVGIRAEEVGERAAKELMEEIDAEVTLDVHAADQMLPYMALAQKTSRFLTREISDHTKTNMWLIRQFLDVDFNTERKNGLWEITIHT